jgi:hypothetical protein
MSLLSTNITKVKKLSLKEVKLPTTRRIAEPVKREPPPTQEEINYSRLVAKNPLIEELVERLDLVSITTGKRIRKVALEPEQPIKELDKTKLIALAQRVIEGENSYTKEEIIERIKKATNVNQERAENGFNLILEAGAIDPTGLNSYYLATSTPF